ncbi:MAG: asparagine synthase-related protein, partial [bacterium]
SSHKIDGKNHKACLKEAYGEMIPDEILNRSKMGFGVPLPEWFREGDRAEYLSALITDELDAFSRLFDRSSVLDLLKKHREKQIDASPLLWALALMKQWMREFNVRV